MVKALAWAGSFGLNRKWVFAMLAFVVPLLVRAVPEVLMGPYVTGFDTMGHYIPTTLLWLKSGVDFWSFLATAPLFYSIVVFLVSSGLGLILVLKVLPTVLLGLLGLCVYGYAAKGLGWSSAKSLASAVLATLYFVALRVSWDMLRTELALIFLFVFLMLFSFRGRFASWKRYLLLGLAMCLVVLSDQLVAAVLFGIIGLTVLYDVLKKRRLEAFRLLLTALPAVLLFLAMFFLSPSVPEYRLIFGFSQTDGWLSLFGFSSYGGLLDSTFGFFLFCFLPVLGFAVLGFRRLKNLQLYAWVLLCAVLSLVPMVSPSNLRWVMLLSYPFAFFAVEGLSRLKLVSWRRLGAKLYRAGAVYLVLMLCVLSGGLIFLAPQNPLLYFGSQVNGYVYQIPSSMLQNTVALSDCNDTANAFQWLANHITSNDIVLSHRAFYGWATLALNQSQVVLYEYDNPADVAASLSANATGRIFVVWWVDGQGWYGQPSVSVLFHEVYRSGEIAVYEYSSR